MKLDELHVDQFRAGVIRERVPVACIFPTVARDFVGPANAAGGKHDRFCFENSETTALAFVTERADDALVVFEQSENGVLHVNLDALMHAVVLQRPDHLETGAIADVGETRIFMATEISLQNAPVFGAIEDRAPSFQFTHAVGRFLRVQLGHAPLVDVLTAAHRVREMHFPVIAIIDIGERGRDAALGHDGMRFAEKRFADESD